MEPRVGVRKGAAWKWGFGILGGLLLVGVASWYLLKRDLSSPRSKVKPLITDQLKAIVLEASDSLYRVSYSRFDLNIDSGTGVIEDLQLLPDSATWKKLVAENRAPDNLLKYRVKRLRLSDFGFTKSDSGRKFTIESLVLESPSLTITNKKRGYNDPAGNEKSKKLLRLLEDVFRFAAIESVAIKDLDFTYENQNGDRPRRTGLYNLDVSIDGLKSAKSGKDGTGKTVLQARTYRIATPDQLYTLSVNNLILDPNTNMATISRVELVPRLGKSQFYETVGYAKDRFHLAYQGLTMRGVDFSRLLTTQELHINSITVGNAWAEIYTDLRYPQKAPPKRWFGSPHELLQALAFDMTIDEMILKDADTYYKVLAKNSRKTATLSILNSHGVIKNITNNRAAVKRNPFMTVSLQSSMMGAGPMNMKMRFNLTNSSYGYTSSMSGMPMAAFNPFSEALALMTVKSGTLNKMELQVNANNKTARGNVDLLYNDLKVTLLKQNENDDQLKKKEFLSALSNTMLPNDNPTRTGKFRTGPIHVEREPNMSFFGFMAAAMLDGMSSSMTGLEQRKDQPNENIATGIAKAITGPKGDREEGKRDRKEKREVKKENKN